MNGRGDVAGGSVDVGGDLRCFGRPPEGSTWRIQVRDPWDDGVCGVFEIAAGAVLVEGRVAENEVEPGSFPTDKVVGGYDFATGDKDPSASHARRRRHWTAVRMISASRRSRAGGSWSNTAR